MTAPPGDDALPPDLHLTRTTDVFDAGTVPAGLLRAHRLAASVWGRLVVHAGRVRLVFEDGAEEADWIDTGEAAVIPPDRAHHVELGDGARFAVEFHRE